jgi:hypothetical protein
LNYAENLRLGIKAALYGNGRTIESLDCTANRGMKAAVKNQGNLLIVKRFTRIPVALESSWDVVDLAGRDPTRDRIAG